jgi:lipopolysaccharide assembly protein A
MIRILVAAPFLFLLVLFALSNPQPTEFKLWPTDYAAVLPLSLAVLSAMGLAFILGALVLWTSVLGARRRARRAEHQARLLEAQVAELKAKLARPAPTEARALMPAAR